ncbi:MAG: hypothetical protein JXA37_05060 [Chloroflexia bacterium]|nr:hypothetical protein [Chloroflexia bacterium]
MRRFLTSGSTVQIVLRVLLLLGLLYYLVTLAGMLLQSMSTMHIDFPCMVEVGGGCLARSERDPTVGNPQIEVYVTVYYADAQGGGCIVRASETTEAEVSGHHFRRDGESLVLDRQARLAPGESWEEDRIVAFGNPWRLTRQRFEARNQGLVECLLDYASGERQPYGPSLVVDASEGSYYDTNVVGLAIGGVLLLGLAFSYVQYRRGRD